MKYLANILILKSPTHPPIHHDHKICLKNRTNMARRGSKYYNENIGEELAYMSPNEDKGREIFSRIDRKS